MFVVTVTFDVKPGLLDRFLPLIVENARASLQEEPECRQFDVCRDENVVFLYEVYEDRKAFEDHLATTHFKAFDAAVGHMIAEKTVQMFEEVYR